MEGVAMHTRMLIAVLLVALALAWWAKTNLGTADDNLPPRYGGGFGPIQILEPLY
jgi:hypothetical protein